MGLLSPTLRGTLQLRALGLFKIPLLFFVSPRVTELSPSRCVVRIPLNYRTKNHLGSMYFGTLAIGADCAGGLIAWKTIEEIDPKVKLVFSTFEAKFLKRGEGPVDFVCDQGAEITEFVKKVAASTERMEMPVRVSAVCKGEEVAQFTLGLSLKKKS